jgi:ribonuclease HI
MPPPALPPRDFVCPRCGARPHEGCQTEDGLPWADHAERMAVARQSARSADDLSDRAARQVRYDVPPEIPEVARRRRLPRDYVRGFTCPKCGSVPGAACVDEASQFRAQNHAARVAVARRGWAKSSAATGAALVWVAGVCPSGPGPGGWAALLRIAGREIELHGDAPLTTKPRMALTALIEAIRALPRTPAQLTVHTESQQLVTALRNGWPAVWRANGWTKQDGMPVRNRDLWELVAREIEPHQIRWRHLTLSDGGPEQARVTAIAAARR